LTHFGERVAEQNGWKPAEFTAGAVQALIEYPWPGNVRELRNVVERLLLLATDNRVDLATVALALPHIAAPTASSQPAASASIVQMAGTLSERVAIVEREVILAEIARQNHHITNTAKALGLERSYLYKKCQQLGIDLREGRK